MADHEHDFNTGTGTGTGVGSLPYVEDWRWLWHTDYYDGPLSGMVLHRDENLWAELVDECDQLEPVGDGTGTYRPRCGYYRRFRLVRLTPGAHAECVSQHELFRQHVGTHWDYDQDGVRVHALRPQSEWHKFYDAIKARPAWQPVGEPVAVITI